MFAAFKVPVSRQMHRRPASIIWVGSELGKNSKIHDVLKVGPVNKKNSVLRLGRCLFRTEGEVISVNVESL